MFMKKQTYKRLTVDLPEDVFKSLKSLAIMKDMNMKDLLTKELTVILEGYRISTQWREKK